MAPKLYIHFYVCCVYNFQCDCSRLLFDKEELSDYTNCVAYLDEDYKFEDQYTVSACFYYEF